MSDRDLRIETGRKRHGVGSSDYLPGNVCHLVSPIVGHLRLVERDARGVDQDYVSYMINRLSLVLDLAYAEDEKVNASSEATS